MDQWFRIKFTVSMTIAEHEISKSFDERPTISVPGAAVKG